MKKRILHLPIKRVYFDAIANKEKPLEFREAKPYWTNRLFYFGSSKMKIFDEIHMRNGYNKERPFMRIKWHGWEIQKHKGKICYAFDVREILEIKNWKK